MHNVSEVGVRQLSALLYFQQQQDVTLLSWLLASSDLLTTCTLFNLRQPDRQTDRLSMCLGEERANRSHCGLKQQSVFAYKSGSEI